jgi:hypothetical protein
MNITNIPIFPDQPPDNQTLTVGEQQSMSIRPVGYGHPAWQNNDMQALVIKAAEAGANVWREAFYVDSDPNNSYYQSVKTSTANAGLKLIVQTLSASVGAMTYQEETNIINDVGTAQDNWVNGWKTIISVMQPYAIMVMNEPTNNGDRNSDPSNGDFNLYRAFCSRCISEWRAVKADLVIIVNNNPFNKLYDSTGYGFAATPLTETNVIYGRHVYYAYDSLYPPNYLPDQQDYWDNLLPEAKIHLEAQMHLEADPLTSQGCVVAWDEWGAHASAPNASQYATDLAQHCEDHGWGCIIYDIVPFGDGTGQEVSGLLTNDYLNWNLVGLAFRNVIYEDTYVPPPVTPPPAQHFHVSFSVGAGGSSDLAAGSYTLLVGQSFAATAYPLANYVPVWTVPGYSPSSEYTFTLAGLADANYAVALTFTYVAPVEPPAPPTPPATSFSVNVGVATGGTTNVIGVQNVLTTSSLSVTATHAANYIFSYWLKDNVNAGSTNPIVVTGIASQTITLRPVFTYIPPQPSPVDPTPGTPVAIAGPLDEVFTVLEAVNIPTIDDIFTQLERIVF